MTDVDRERARQQALVDRLTRPGAPDPTGLRPARRHRGLAAYDTNAAGAAERALAGTFPTVQAMLGDEPFAGLARALWFAHPPTVGDLARWGDALPAFVASDPVLAPWPYLADCARLDLAVARCAAAADPAPDLATLALLGEVDADDLVLELAPGTAVLASEFPIVTLRAAHRGAAGPESLALAREALAAGRPECARVWRTGWRAEVVAEDLPAHRFGAAVCAGLPLGAALREAGDTFAFEPWLVHAVQRGGLLRVKRRG